MDDVYCGSEMFGYKCYFYLPEWVHDYEKASRERLMVAIDDKPEIPGLERMAAFINGFWIDENFELCIEQTGVYWIPPAAICMIARFALPQEYSDDHWTDPDNEIPEGIVRPGED